MRNYLEKTIFNNKPNYAAAQCHDNKTCSKDYKLIQPRKAIKTNLCDIDVEYALKIR